MTLRTRLSATDRRDVTVETVMALAGEGNPAEITTAAIAERMNLTQGAVFRHFPTKEAIWQAVMEWVAARLLARVDTAIKDNASPLAALEAVFHSHVAFVSAHPGVPRMLFGELQRADDTAAKKIARIMIGHYSERISALIVRGKAEHELAADVDVDAAVMLFVGTIQGLVMQSLLAGDIARLRNDAVAVFSIFRSGIESR
ncbi:MAG: TetR/AcrR family transcriptional regulator [Dokdonella sp.]